MSKAPVPQVAGGDGESCRGCFGAEEGVQVAITIGAEEEGLGSKILHGKAKRVKLNGNRIITGKFTN